MTKRVKMLIAMEVTKAQGLALQAMFEHWNYLSAIGSSRDISFCVDGDGNFHPKCTVFFSEKMPELTNEMKSRAVVADHDGNRCYDFDPIAWMLPDDDPPNEKPISAAEAIDNLKGKQHEQGRWILEVLGEGALSADLTSEQKSVVPNVIAAYSEDGDLILEWIFPKRRLGFAIDYRDASQSSWFSIRTNPIKADSDYLTMSDESFARMIDIVRDIVSIGTNEIISRANGTTVSGSKKI